MRSDGDEQHSEQVDAWIAKNAAGLPSEKLVPLFVEAIQAIRKRSLVTLSEVTFGAIFDRALWMSQKKYPLFSEVESESSISVDALMAQTGDWTSDQITDAFRFFLTQLLTLLGNLTGHILCKPLHTELFKVTVESIRSSSKSGQRGLRSVKGNLDREDS